MAVNLTITTKWIRSWEGEHKCNDCDNLAVRWVKFPKFKSIAVCIDCYNKYYQEQILRKEVNEY